ncbi:MULTISPECIES: transposase, partial [Shigella]
SGAGRTSDGNGSHASTLKSPSYTKSVSWQHYLFLVRKKRNYKIFIYFVRVDMVPVTSVYLSLICPD